MKNPILLFRAVFYILACLVCSSFQGEKTEKPKKELPNIVLLMGDDHGWDEVGYNGHPYLHTPVLDEMAATGLRMDRFYSASPICSPTRGSIITGRHPNRYGTFTPGFSIRPEEISIAQIMKDAGYATAHFGKWHLGPVKAGSPTNPKAMGFDEYLSHDNFFEMNPHLSRNGDPERQFEGESSEILIAEAIRFIQKAKENNQPFFVVIWYGSPHEPYSGLPEDLALYEDLPKSFANKKVSLTSNQTGNPVERLQRDVLRERFAEITAMDRSIGMMRKYLDDQEIRDNTLLWYFGDNGTPQEGNATGPFRGFKGSVYEGGIRVPSVLEWPSRIPKPIVSPVNAVSADLLPTLADLVGQALPDRPLDGINLMPLFEGKMVDRPETIQFWNGSPRKQEGYSPLDYIDAELQKGTSPLAKLMDGISTRNFKNFHHPNIQAQDFGGPRAILDNRYKLVIHGQIEGRVSRELFDVRADSAEKINLIAEKPEIAEKLEKQLLIWQQSVLESLMGEDYRNSKASEDSIADMDIYLLIGQSNMAGRGELGEDADHVLPNVYLFNGVDWEPASNPLNKFSTVKKDIIQGLGPGYTFGQRLAEKSSNPIGLIVNARGGTTIQQWQKGFEGKEDFDLFEKAVNQVRKIKHGGNLKGIIWHQGESNQSNLTGYLELLKKLVSDLRADLENEELIFIAGELGHWQPRAEAVNQIIQKIPENIRRGYFITAEGLTPLNNDPTDPHFDGLSQRVLGERYADKVLEIMAESGNVRKAGK